MLAVVVAVLVCVPILTFVVGRAVSSDQQNGSGPTNQDYVDITTVPIAPSAPTPSASASRGSYAEHCGGPSAVHRNADNGTCIKPAVNQFVCRFAGEVLG